MNTIHCQPYLLIFVPLTFNYNVMFVHNRSGAVGHHSLLLRSVKIKHLIFKTDCSNVWTFNFYLCFDEVIQNFLVQEKKLILIIM